MNLLLDTCTFLWIAADAPELSEVARTAFTNPDNEVVLSSISAWEIAVNYHLGKLPLPEPPERFVPAQRKLHDIGELVLDEEAALAVYRLPELQRDPFDRMLVCQALAAGMAILTPDSSIARYPVRCVW